MNIHKVGLHNKNIFGEVQIYGTLYGNDFPRNWMPPVYYLKVFAYL